MINISQSFLKEFAKYNGWVYEQVCLAECFKLPTNLMANLLIYRVISSCGLFSRNLNTENEKKLLLK
jgi:hypothetical protein